ncbi:hypothetical protein GCM10009678_01340 [Actinomadura kijaniata]|uniref:Undecaprenyl-diphosphatase n=1 Tax=Actinomadura namibiensis TaxID=182080 RepID=A0A7W3LSE6_ACTNM|nr:phosphatase PAP2 family protein [Actinomadura namibiensis]MBA8953340.1 undecaprenyl-diphosphatase [Actinomadura namibiensis]
MQAPDFSADWYRSITEWAHGMPSWTHPVAEVGTDAGLLLFAALFVAGWWRARTADSRAMGLALLAPVGMVTAYLTSEISKSFLQEERPCRAVAHAMNIAACPAYGDWSFPSNHSTIAAASAAAIVVAWRTMAPLVLPLAALMAFSRVYVGVHYPHDVAAGYLLGVIVAPVVALLLVRLVAPLVTTLRRMPVGVLLLGPAPAAVAATGPGAGPMTHGPAHGPAHGQTHGPAHGRGPSGQGPRGWNDHDNPAAVTMPDVMGGIPAPQRPAPPQPGQHPQPVHPPQSGHAPQAGGRHRRPPA